MGVLALQNVHVGLVPDCGGSLACMPFTLIQHTPITNDYQTGPLSSHRPFHRTRVYQRLFTVSLAFSSRSAPCWDCQVPLGFALWLWRSPGEKVPSSSLLPSDKCLLFCSVAASQDRGWGVGNQPPFCEDLWLDFSVSPRGEQLRFLQPQAWHQLISGGSRTSISHLTPARASVSLSDPAGSLSIRLTLHSPCHL